MTLPRVQRIRRGGVIRYRYHRITGARLPDLPEDDPRFIAAWGIEEAKGAPRVASYPEGSIGHLVDAYLSSATHKAASPSYQAMLRRHLLAIAGEYGDADAATLRANHMAKDVAKLAGSVALHRQKAWRKLTKWMKRSGLIEVDPGRLLERPERAETEGHVPWSADDVKAFRDRHPSGTQARALFEVAYWTGARVGDVGGLTRTMIRDGILTYRQAKTGGEAHVPWTCPLPSYALHCADDRDQMHAALAALTGEAALLIVPTQDGARRTPKGASNTINDGARAAGLKRRTAHGLRKARLIALAEGGATTHGLAAWGGHESLSEVEHYTRAANRRGMVRGVKDIDESEKKA